MNVSTLSLSAKANLSHAVGAAANQPTPLLLQKSWLRVVQTPAALSYIYTAHLQNWFCCYNYKYFMTWFRFRVIKTEF